jgi:hypothetical protein
MGLAEHLHIEIDIVFGSDDGHSTEATTLFLTITESAKRDSSQNAVVNTQSSTTADLDNPESANRDSSQNAAVNTPSLTAADLDNPAAEGGATRFAVRLNSETMQSMAAATLSPLLLTGDLPSESDTLPVESVVGSGMGNPEQSPSEPSGHDQNPTGVPPPRAAYPDSYDNSPFSDSYFPPQLGFGARSRTFSPGYGPPTLLHSAPLMAPFPSYNGKPMRRSSSIGPGIGLAGHMSMSGPYGLPGGVTVKFRLSGGRLEGVTLTEAMNSVRLSRGHSYAVRDIADMRSRLTLKVRVRFSSIRTCVSPSLLVPLLHFCWCDFTDG